MTLPLTLPSLQKLSHKLIKKESKHKILLLSAIMTISYITSPYQHMYLWTPDKWAKTAAAIILMFNINIHGIYDIQL